MSGSLLGDLDFSLRLSFTSRNLHVSLSFVLDLTKCIVENVPFLKSNYELY